MKKEVNMTDKEIARADIFSEISQKKISKTEAAKRLGISFRHLHRLYSEYQQNGLIALTSKRRGRPSNHQLPEIIKARVKELVTCEEYAGFAPTFMREILKDNHKIKICIETTRQLMVQSEVWTTHKKKCPVIHQQRQRRACSGELIQIDGSPHAWFENRGDPCVLILFVDDATGRTYGRFFEAETTQAYMETTYRYISKYGRPIAFYSDKYGVFRVNKSECLKKEPITQFGRACKELDIEIICANTPQAKGRVERGNRTHQQRLVWALRLRKISTIDEANQFLEEEYWNEFNKNFSVSPRNEKDVHRKLISEENLDRILCYKTQRTVSKNLEVQHNNIIYQITLEKPSRALRKAHVMVVERLDGVISIEYKGKPLPFRKFLEQEYMGKEINSKEIDRFLKDKKEYHVPDNHPWKAQLIKVRDVIKTAKKT